MNDDFLRALPKVQLHCHLEGTVQPATFLELGREAGLDLPERVYAFETFPQFLLEFQAVCRALGSAHAFGRVAREYAEDAAAQGVRYAEIFISPSVWSFFHPGIDERACVRAIREALDEAKDRIEVALICDLTRNLGAESAMRSTQNAIDWRDLGVIAIGLGGDEARFPASLFVESYGLARREGLHAVAHAGEAAGADSVRETIEALEVERIGHGIRAVEDPGVVAMLAAAAIPLEVCPTSNRRTGAWMGEDPHPMGALDLAGAVVTIDCDDPAMFGAGLLDEYRFVEETLGRDTVLRFARNAIGASFASERRKAGLLKAFDRAAANVPG